MRQVDVSSLNQQRRRRIHIRKPKNPLVAITSLTRGHRNNGLIDVYDDDSEGSDSEFYEHEENIGNEDEGKIYKLPTTGIKLDFIDKVKEYVC